MIEKLNDLLNFTITFNKTALMNAVYNCHKEIAFNKYIQLFVHSILTAELGNIDNDMNSFIVVFNTKQSLYKVGSFHFLR